jgi:hypothetical protein
MLMVRLLTFISKPLADISMKKIFLKHDYELLKRLAKASDTSEESIRKTSTIIMKALIELADKPLPEDKEEDKHEYG